MEKFIRNPAESQSSQTQEADSADADMSDADDEQLQDSDHDGDDSTGETATETEKDPDAPVSLPQNFGMNRMAQKLFKECKRR